MSSAARMGARAALDAIATSRARTGAADVEVTEVMQFGREGDDGAFRVDVGARLTLQPIPPTSEARFGRFVRAWIKGAARWVPIDSLTPLTADAADQMRTRAFEHGRQKPEGCVCNVCERVAICEADGADRADAALVAADDVRDRRPKEEANG